MKAKGVWLLLSLCLTSGSLKSQEKFHIMEYNVENLFDCRHDSLKKDTEFLPESIRGWNSFRLKTKVNNISKVIYSACQDNVPELVGLCEVENKYCLDLLTRYSILSEAGYRYVMTESPDERGIDVALLYQPFKFRLISEEHIRMCYGKAERPTRDLLHVCGRIVSGELLDVFLCHMPSRTGGRKVSEPYRIYTATRLREKVDSVLKVRQDANIVIMGDFNDYADNKAIIEVLGASKPGQVVASTALYNLMNGKMPGTYRYKGEWGILDHMIVNGRMLDKTNSIFTTYDNVRILMHPFLLEEDEKHGGVKPYRTYNGMKYQGGFSDHLPIVGEFNIRRR